MANVSNNLNSFWKTATFSSSNISFDMPEWIGDQTVTDEHGAYMMKPYGKDGWLKCPHLFAINGRGRTELEVYPADKRIPTTFGWRGWFWDPKRRVLISPYMLTHWNTYELEADNWEPCSEVRSQAGIHARLVPEGWEAKILPDVRYPAIAVDRAGNRLYDTKIIYGIVERFRRFQLGEEGWRAEWVVIRKLLAPDDETGLALEQVYPEVEVIYGHR